MKQRNKKTRKIADLVLNINPDNFIREAITVLIIIAGIVATIMSMTYDSFNIIARIMISILSWILALGYLAVVRQM